MKGVEWCKTDWAKNKLIAKLCVCGNEHFGSKKG